MYPENEYLLAAFTVYSGKVAGSAEAPRIIRIGEGEMARGLISNPGRYSAWIGGTYRIVSACRKGARAPSIGQDRIEGAK